MDEGDLLAGTIRNPGTPRPEWSWTTIPAGLLAHRSSSFPQPSQPVQPVVCRGWLAVYSCGGSPGISGSSTAAPDSLFIPSGERHQGNRVVKRSDAKPCLVRASTAIWLYINVDIRVTGSVWQRAPHDSLPWKQNSSHRLLFGRRHSN